MLGGELQPAPGDHRQPADLADDDGDPAGRLRSAQSLFKHPQDVVVARCLHHDDARRVEPMFREPGAVKVAALQAPQHQAGVALSGDAPGDAGGKPGRRSAVFLVTARALEFVQRAQGQPTARQRVVERRDSKRQNAVTGRIRPLDAADAVLQSDKAGGR